MDTKVQKWGNSLALRIPKAYAEQMGLDRNSPVRLSLQNDRLVVERVERLSLDELLASVDPDNVHGETDWGDDVGNEVL